MKWYTLDERPLKMYDQGLFITQHNAFYYCIYDRNIYDPDEFVLYPVVDIKCCYKEIDYVLESDIKYWIPAEELKATLPKDKE